MTEQEKTSAVVEETREAVDTTSQPVATEKKSKNNTALILSAVAIAIALAAGIGLYGWGKQQCCRYFIHSSFRLNIQRLDPLSGTVNIKASLICRCITKCPYGCSFKHASFPSFLIAFLPL